jgi:GTPase
VKDSKHVAQISEQMANSPICPIFPVSNVTGEGIDNFKTFLANLPCNPSNLLDQDEEYKQNSQQDLIETEFEIDS